VVFDFRRLTVESQLHLSTLTGAVGGVLSVYRFQNPPVIPSATMNPTQDACSVSCIDQAVLNELRQQVAELKTERRERCAARARQEEVCLRGGS
jgi:hypothetical protein